MIIKIFDVIEHKFSVELDSDLSAEVANFLINEYGCQIAEFDAAGIGKYEGNPFILNQQNHIVSYGLFNAVIENGSATVEEIAKGLSSKYKAQLSSKKDVFLISDDQLEHQMF